MRQIKPSAAGERPDENPYSPPRTEIGPAVDENESDEVGTSERNTYAVNHASGSLG